MGIGHGGKGQRRRSNWGNYKGESTSEGMKERRAREATARDQMSGKVNGGTTDLFLRAKQFKD